MIFVIALLQSLILYFALCFIAVSLYAASYM